MKKKLLLLTAILMLFSCVDDISKKEESFDFNYIYRSYFHVSRDIENEKEIYHYDYTPLNRTQVTLLIEILKERNAGYKISSDSTILVSTVSIPDAYSMSCLDDELKKRIGKKGYRWSN